MITEPFDYAAPETVREAIALLAEPGTRALAGGMSLVPLMKLRLSAPEKLVDLRRIASLKSIQQDGGELRVGAMVTHYELESTPLVRTVCPLLAQTAAAIGDVQIRNAGTIGGSVAHADPAADYPAALFALEAKVELTGAGGARTVAIGEFLLDTFTTSLEPGEIVTAVIVPVEAAGVGTSYYKVPQPASGFPVVGVAVRVAKSSGKIAFARVGVTGLAGQGYRAEGVEARLMGTAGTAEEIKAAAAAAADGVDANSDIHASAAYRAHLARVSAARAITAALG